MSYTVLARRYRSGTFDEVVGQDHVAQTLKKAIASGRVAHAYLFCGTRGVGKTSMARILAKALNCQSFDGPTTEPCGKCDSCQAISRGDDIDVIEIDAASNTGVDNVREVIENSQYRPARSRFKIYIVDEAHMLSKAAFNALLKTLEEPPSHVKFILATTEAEKLLPTILSRCQRYDFRNIPTREIAEHLADLCGREKVKADEDALLLVAKAGAGSMRDSLSLLDRLLSIGEKHLTAEMIEQLLGLPKTQLLFDLAGAISAGEVKAVLRQASAMVQAGLSPDSLIVALVDHLRNLLILRTCGADSNLVEAPGVLMDDLLGQAERFDPAVLAQDIVILEELRRTLRQSQAGRALLEATLVRLALADQFASIGQLLEQVANGEAPTPAAPRSAAMTAPSLQKKKAAEAFAGPVEASRPAALNGNGQHLDADGEREPSSAPAMNAAPAPAAVVAADAADDEDDDDLPAVGKVWEGGSVSLATLMSRGRARAPSVSSAVAEPVPTPQIAPVDADASQEGIVDAPDLSAMWQTMLDALSVHGPMLHSLVAQGRLTGIEDERVVLTFAPQNETFVRQWEKSGKRELIQAAASNALGRSVGVKFEIDPAPSADAVQPARPATPPTKRPKPAHTEAVAAMEPTGVRVTNELVEELARGTPIIRSVMQRFGAAVVKVE